MEESRINIVKSCIETGEFNESGDLINGTRKYFIMSPNDYEEGQFDPVTGNIVSGKIIKKSEELFDVTINKVDELTNTFEGIKINSRGVNIGTFDMKTKSLLHGTRIIKDGRYSKGDFYNSDKQYRNFLSHGIHIDEKGIKYEGDFNEDGNFIKGRKTFLNGDIYDGVFSGCELEKFVKGKKIFANKEIHDGEFDENQRFINGKKIYPPEMGDYTMEGVFTYEPRFNTDKLVHGSITHDGQIYLVDFRR